MEKCGLTSDNHHLSRLTTSFAASSSLQSLQLTADPGVADLVRQSLSESSRRAYVSDLAHFGAWGGGIPTSPDMVASYIAAHASTLSVATLVRRMASIGKAHRAAGMANPTSSELVKATMRGIKRTRGRAQRQAKPLLHDELLDVLAATGEGINDVRDRALLLLGFAAALRRSELVGLDLADVEHVREGIILHLRRSKTDQDGEGRDIGVPFARGRWCPVLSLGAWVEAAGISNGAVFRPVSRHGNVSAARLSGDAVSGVVRRRIAAAGMKPAGYSGHSLRAGLATSAAQAGLPGWLIRRQTGHASDAMLARYIRDGELFTRNAAGALL